MPRLYTRKDAEHFRRVIREDRERDPVAYARMLGEIKEQARRLYREESTDD